MEISVVYSRDEIELKVVLEKDNEKEIGRVAKCLLDSLGFKVNVRVFTQDELNQLGSSKLKNFIDHRPKDT